MADEDRYEITEDKVKEGPPNAEGRYSYNVMVNSTAIAAGALAIAGIVFFMAS